MKNPLFCWILRNPLRPWIFSTVDFFSHPPVGGFLAVDFQTRAVDFDKSGLICGTPLSRWIFNFVDFDEERKIRQFEKAKSTALFTAKFTAIFSRWISKIHRGKKSTNSKSTENPPNSKSTVEKNPPWKKIHQIQNPPWKKIHQFKIHRGTKSTVHVLPIQGPLWRVMAGRGNVLSQMYRGRKVVTHVLGMRLFVP